MKTFTPLPQPQPFTPVLEQEYKYLVVRGDGCGRFFDHVGVAHNKNDDYWCPIGIKTIRSEWVVIPMDMLTAFNLGLVTIEELNLPEHIQAIFHVFKTAKP